MTPILKKTIHYVLPLLLGAFVLYWVYRDFDFLLAWHSMLYEMDWGWMLFSLVFGILAPLFRGLRWKQLLDPLVPGVRTSDCVNSIYLTYATNLIVPRAGEITRCGLLAKYDDVPFAQSVGTVVTERLIDVLTMLVFSALVFLLQMPVFLDFFRTTGTKMQSLEHLLATPWTYVTLFSIIGIVVLLHFLVRRLSIYNKVKGVVYSMRQGLLSVGAVKNKPLFWLYTILIWLCYFLHFYVAFRCFGFSAHLGVMAALVMFVAGTFAVIVPTPNGAGPWHFAVITMMMLYGVTAHDASTFALLVHGIQTLLVVLLGIWGWLRFSFSSR
ncbi:MAG: flippase-like domain-containing protein [Bacteroidaceae bacterium]|nr:flippase-like domain-containing protein [Bacteroidaceae bacterium]